MRMKDIKKKSQADLEKALKERQEKSRLFRFGVAGAKSKNVKEGRELKKDVARILTELQIRENSK